VFGNREVVDVVVPVGPDGGVWCFGHGA
jgi:hypothetical protein